jgi:hypothetical protein
MSLWRRLARAYETLSQQHLDERTAFGERGEEDAAWFILQAEVACCIRNPMLPAADSLNHPLESDFLIYTLGNLFCIEVKNYKGRLWYADNAVTGKRILMRQKVGNYGEFIPPEEQRDPARQVRTFIHHLKTRLVSMDGRFRGLYIIPVVAFSPRSDISAIYSLEDGLISIRDLPTFFRMHAHPRFADRLPAPWIREALQQLPRADVIVTSQRERFKGFLLDRELRFQDAVGQEYTLPYANIRSVALQRDGLFSAYDVLMIEDANGQRQSLRCAKGNVRFQTLEGQQQIHHLRNINLIEVGRTSPACRTLLLYPFF